MCVILAQSKIRRLKQQSKSLSKQQTAILKRDKEEGAKVSRSPEAPDSQGWTHRHTDTQTHRQGSKVSRSPEVPDRVKVGLRVKMVASCQSNLCPVVEC